MKTRRFGIPTIIQGGMGVGVSGYRLARAAAESGALGVVSGTAIDTVFVRRIQLGLMTADIDEAAASFPFPLLASHVIQRYRGRVAVGRLRFKMLSLPSTHMAFDRLLAMVLAAYIEVWLARRGHDKPIGMNLLEKIQLPTLPTLFGGILAGLDVVLVGAGVPAAIPGFLKHLVALEPTTLKLHVDGGIGLDNEHVFEPATFLEECAKREGALGGRQVGSAELFRPSFLAIVSSEILAKRLLKTTNGEVDGFVLEHHSAGGHNAPPRKGLEVGFGPLDEPKLGAMRELGVPFWLAGARGSHSGLAEALQVGAAGVQVGSAFAFCEESDITEDIKQRVLRGLERGGIAVETDFRASPTGYPFKIVVDRSRPSERLDQGLRPRVCDLGYLRQAYAGVDGALGFRCSGEPEEQFVQKGGNVADSEGKLCLCNQLLATVGLAQRRDGYEEVALVTAGSDLSDLLELVASFGYQYRAQDVVHRLMSPLPRAGKHDVSARNLEVESDERGNPLTIGVQSTGRTLDASIPPTT